MMLAALALAVPAPSFDCAKASTKVEQMICADAQLAAADRAMAKLYAGVPQSDRTTRREQAQWLSDKFGRARCADKDCLVREYESRLSFLFGASRTKTREYKRRNDFPGSLSVLPIGAGWYAFKANGLYVRSVPAAATSAEATGVFKLVNGKGSRAPQYEGDCGWKVERLPHDRWRLAEWTASDDWVPCGGLNATIHGTYSR